MKVLLGTMKRCLENDDASRLPFQTQWLGDDDNEAPDFDEVEDGGDDLLAATQGQLKRVRPETVNYAKRAKRVDVKKLKETIWKELEEVSVQPETPAISESTPQPESENFTSVISGLRRTYPKDKMEEISTSFCFICLLHLCNEKGLGIEKLGAATDDDSEVKLSVGGLQDLRVFRQVLAPEVTVV